MCSFKETVEGTLPQAPDALGLDVCVFSERSLVSRHRVGLGGEVSLWLRLARGWFLCVEWTVRLLERVE